MQRLLKWAALLCALAMPTMARAQEATITVRADQLIHPVSRLLTGACIEDVNHEIYGGLYSQMIFGESFQEPPPSRPPQGFRAYGGRWRVRGEELHFSGSPGDKLVSELPPFADGEVGVEVFMAGKEWSNVGLLARAGRAGNGVDSFDGYEIALNAADQNLRLGRHRQNWEHIKDIPCEVPVGRWVTLVVRLSGRTLEVLLDSKSIVRHEDGPGAILSGTVGLRAFQGEARYRNLWVRTDGQMRRLRFIAGGDESADVSGMWRSLKRGAAAGRWEIDRDQPFLGAQSQRLSLISGEGEVGIENQGLNRWGMHFVEGKLYEGLIWVRSERPIEVWVALESADGAAVHAERPLQLSAGDWQKLEFALTPRATEPKGRFAIKLKHPGSVSLGYAFLQPGAWGRFKDLPVRRDVTEALIDQGITVLRYGGSMINHPEYRWKKMIGPRDRRPPCRGTWYPHSSNGWGIVDFMAFCEAARFEYIPAFNIDETPQDMADFIDYAKAPEETDWGRRRAADGHPQPFRLRYLQLGNEERVDETYAGKFEALARAIWAKDRDIILVVGDFLYSRRIEDPMRFTGSASGITTLAAHRRILGLAKAHNREVWFDVHVGTDGPRPDSTLEGTFSFIDALARIADGAKHKVVIFEFNAGNHAQKRALANALAIQAVERDGRIPIALSANCLQPDGQNDNGWNQGLLFLNPSQVWLQPPGYITRMLSRNYLPRLVRCDVAGTSDRLDVNAKRSQDGRTLVLQVVNTGHAPVATRIRIDGFAPVKPAAQVIQLAGPLDAVNTAARTDVIVPKQSECRDVLKDGNAGYTFPPHSFTVLRFE